MSYGINVRNNSGKIVFSTIFPAYQLHSIQAVATGSNSFGSFLVSSTHPPLVFVTPNTSNDNPPMVSSISSSGSGWTVTVSNGLANSQALVYVFCKPASPQSTGYGINVYGNDGSINFSTQARALKISGYHITNLTYKTDLTSSVIDGLTSGTIPVSYAVACSNLGFYATPLGNGQPRILLCVGAKAHSANQVNIRRSTAAVLRTIPGGGDEFLVGGGQYILFIDRTLYD